LKLYLCASITSVPKQVAYLTLTVYLQLKAASYLLTQPQSNLAHRLT